MANEMNNVTIQASSIGAGQADLSKYILNSDEVLQENYYRLHGYIKTIKPGSDGKATIIWEKKEDMAYSDECISFMDSKLAQILSKDQKLSNYNTELEMNKEGWVMVESFIWELALQLKEFDITQPEKFKVLVKIYSNILSQAIRHPLYQGDKDFLSKTTSETTTKIQQDQSIREQRGGIMGKLPLIGGLFGG